MNPLAFLGILAVTMLPHTNNYQLNSYGFGSGGATNSRTATYALEGNTGQAAGNSSSTNYQTKPGYIETQQANVPKLASIDNNGGIYYNKLHFVIDPQNNPTDAKYLVAVSTDNFTSPANTKYVQLDGTLTTSLSTANYRTYSGFGGSAGSLVIGLDSATTYYVKLKATQGTFSESAYGPVSVQATAAASISFNLTTSATSTPPYVVGLGTLNAGSIATTPDTVNTTLTTNAAVGANVYITGKNGGLLSSATGNKITAGNVDLSSVAKGFGVQNNAISQTSGGPYSVLSPYSVTGTNVGIIDAITRSLYTTGAPITSGTGKLVLKAKAASTDIAATDYQEILTFTAAGNF